jgi:hypothetical protein
VGQERPHAEFVGQNEALPVEGFSLSDFWGIALRSDLIPEPEGSCLVSRLLVSLSKP